MAETSNIAVSSEAQKAEIDKLRTEVVHYERAANWLAGELAWAEVCCPYLGSDRYANSRSYPDSWYAGLSSATRCGVAWPYRGKGNSVARALLKGMRQGWSGRTNKDRWSKRDS